MIIYLEHICLTVLKCKMDNFMAMENHFSTHFKIQKYLKYTNGLKKIIILLFVTMMVWL